MRHRQLLATALMALLAGSVAPAQAGWQVYQPSDGLIDPTLYAVEVAPDGSVWFVSMYGVSRYDGLTWTSFPKGPDFAVSGFAPEDCCVLADRRGTVWVTSNGIARADAGLYRYDGVRWEPVWTDIVEHAREAIEDREGNLWFALRSGVARFDGTDWVRFTTADGLVDNRVRSVIQDHSGNLWFGTEGGVSRFDGRTWTSYVERPGGLGDNYVPAMVEDGAGNIWFGCDPLTRFDGETWTTVTGVPGITSWSGISSMARDPEDRIWMTIYGTGVVRYDGVQWKLFRDSDDTRIVALHGIDFDAYGNVWIASRLGALRFDGQNWDAFRPGSTTTSSTVFFVEQLAPLDWWIATQGGLYHYRDGRQDTLITAVNGQNMYWVSDVKQTRDGRLWVASYGRLWVRDGETWSYADLGGAANCILEHRSGDVYVTTEGAGVFRFAGGDTLRYYPDALFKRVIEDPDGNIWVAGSGGVWRFDGAEWTSYTTADCPALQSCMDISSGRDGTVWVGTTGGAVRFDGREWTTFTTTEGLAHNYVRRIFVDANGHAWCGNEHGSLCRFDGTFWTTFTERDGLLGAECGFLGEDYAGRILAGNEWGISIIEEDRVPPRTFFRPRPPVLSAGRRQSCGLAAGYGEVKGIRYSSSLDGAPWSPWTEENTWAVESLADGLHTLEVRARDYWGNVDPHPAHAVIEIDGTPPVPILAPLGAGNVARGEAPVRGTASDARFESYRLLVRPVGVASWDPPAATLLAQAAAPVLDGVLADWNTLEFDDGDYELRLEVADTLGLVGVALSRVIVDNEAPWADQTSPAAVSAALGGDVFTASGNVHLYFPPHAFAEAAVVTASALGAGEIPDTLSSGALRLDLGHAIEWTGGQLRKRATLDVALGALPEPAGLRIALYVQPEGGAWERVGGTIDTDTHRLTAPIQVAGRYALYEETGPAAGGAPLSELALTPRVFSPAGSFAASAVAISFRLGEPGPVSVHVFNRAGRLVRRIVSGRPFEAGYNLVGWTGTDDDGAVVPDGLYLVAVESRGHREVRPLSVVR